MRKGFAAPANERCHVVRQREYRRARLRMNSLATPHEKLIIIGEPFAGADVEGMKGSVKR
jgi:hypothetical protein